MNTGFTGHAPVPRDENTFSRIEDHDWDKKRGKIVELCVDNKVKNISKYIVDAYVIKGTDRIRTLTSVNIPPSLEFPCEAHYL